ncbi:hypothetical protein [Petrocella sp. FN5]|uniref:hypothetical protein n=1 Tax=Petrocella sp. FN5 TaxID=3032002 RepID=UPI0023DC9D23|nr:hypothetical protein [Petrocella sp. FN5]MDF1617764.1 hypothetical protein [Petrocella sp. FN5]
MTNYSGNKINYYSIYGIKIATELVLNELVKMDGESDLIISSGKVPEFLKGTTQSYAFFQTKENEFLARIKNVGSFYVINGNEIIYDLYNDAEFISVKMYLYGFLLPVVLMQRGQFSLHGSCIEIEGKSIIIAGHSGAGKSSLGIAFRLAGYKLIADDLIAFNEDWLEGLYVHYGFPVQKITSDTAKHLKIKTMGLEKIPEDDKYLIPLKDEFLMTPVPLVALFEITLHEDETKGEVVLEELMGGEKLRCIIANTYNVQMIGTMGLAQKHFKYGTSLTKRIKVFRITRPIHGFSLEQQMALIVNAIKKTTF